MESKNTVNENYFGRLQELYFALSTNEASTPSLQADRLRCMTTHLRLAQQHDILPIEAEASVLNEYEEAYGRIVDCTDTKNGLNNYAEGALAICSKHKNESQKWKSSLTLDSIKSKPFYKTIVSQAQFASNAYLPPGTENDILLKEDDKPRAVEPQSSNQSNFGFRKIANQQNAQQPQNNFVENNARGNIPPKSFFNSDAQTKLGKRSNFGDQADSNQRFSKQHDEDDLFSRKRPLFSNNGSRNGGGNFTSGRGQPSLYKHVQRPPAEQEPDHMDDEENNMAASNPFKTAKQQLAIDHQKKYGRGGGQQGQTGSSSYGTGKKSLGTRRGPSSKFIPPIAGREENGGPAQSNNAGSRIGIKGDNPDEPVDERLKGIDPKMIELIMNEIMDHGPQLDWNDIAGLEFAKKTIKEIVVWPMLRPDIFTGLRGPPKGLLLFGPPGTGKTLIGKCIASQSKSTFFSISASSLTSKWVGEGEKMVRALFAVARCNQPAVVFIDEIDSLLSQRSDGEHEASRRIKTEFLVQLDGAGTDSEDRILVIGATNRPQEIDEAARRRFVKRLYIPLPETVARSQIINNLLSKQNYHLTEQDVDTICAKTDGYSGADMANLCREAALGPVRSIPFDQIETITADQVPPITFVDFEAAFTQVRASVSEKDLDLYIDWNNLYGSFGKT